MNFLNLDWELILLILKTYNDYKYCIRLLMTCKQLYQNKLLMKEIKNYFTEYKVDKYKRQCWYFNGKFHRKNDKPAVIYYYGTQEWYFNGNLHRENDNPSIIYSDGSKVWYLNGICHRENGPAINHAYGDKEWRLYGKYYTEDKYWKEMEKID